MSRMRELAERQALLQLRCSEQRRAMGREVGAIEQRLQTVDRVALAAKRAVRNPIVIALGVAAIVAIGPKRILGYAGRSAVVASVARRALGMLRR
jgi:hypothetical protein